MIRHRVVLPRRRARIMALQTLYEHDSSGHSLEESMGRLIGNDSLGAGGDELVREIVRGTVANLHAIDDLITEYAPAWPVNQMPMVDRNVLRMAIFELVFGHSAPDKVVINEAVDLARTFGSESSSRFVNGVLGSIVEKFSETEIGARG